MFFARIGTCWCAGPDTSQGFSVYNLYFWYCWYVWCFVRVLLEFVLEFDILNTKNKNTKKASAETL